MRISGRDLKKIIKEEIGREMKQHANNETLSKHSSLTKEDDISYEDEYEDTSRPRSDAEIAAASEKEVAAHNRIKSKSKLFQYLASPEYRAAADASAEDNARFAAMMADPESFNSRTASTREPIDFGTTKITPDEVIDIDDALPEGKNITERLMERWLK